MLIWIPNGAIELLDKVYSLLLQQHKKKVEFVSIIKYYKYAIIHYL